MEELITHSPDETKTIAADILKRVKGGDIIGLRGDLGSGKTTFTQGLAEALGIEGPITSPTFIFMQVYAVKHHSSIKQLCHVDAYRLHSEEDALSIGITDYLGRPDTLCLIEWPDNIGKLLPSSAKIIEFDHIDECTRRLVIKEK